MKALIDLHMHTHYSDGRASVLELLQHAKHLGLKTIAITDHETTKGVREAQSHVQDLGLELIPGIEITCYWHNYHGHGGGTHIDVLGYFLDLNSERLKEAEQTFFKDIKARAAIMCEHLRSQGFEINLEDVLAINPHFPGFLPIMQFLQTRYRQRQGLALTIQEASNVAGPSQVSIEEAIGIIHECGGVAVLAHPSIIRRQDGEPLNERGVAELVEMGLDGIEVLHYRLNEMQRRHFALLAKMFDLAMTGGSDEHGWPSGFPRLGQEQVSFGMLDQLKQKHQNKSLVIPG